ncbi:MAG: hypothetical protein ACFE8M_05915 [Candidatus Hermodarchaeota archaeon]
MDRSNNVYLGDNHKKVKSSPVIPGGGTWITNGTFPGTVQPWFPDEEGDIRDVNTSFTSNHANFEIIGDQGIFSEISGTPTSQDWDAAINPLFPVLPDNVTIDEHGCKATHDWEDPSDTNQTTSIHWERIITMPVDMSDYEITSASISSVFNATVTATPGGNYGIEVPGDQVDIAYPDHDLDYDTARFYVLLSDLADYEIYEVAWYQTIDLGNDSAGAYDYMSDTFMNSVVEEALIFYLSSLFERDSYHIKITLGIRIKCADNWNLDRDRWDSLRIKTCELTFKYEKKINQFTKVSWNQECDDISGENIYITDSTLNFKYKIDQAWPEFLSPNSEIIISLNKNNHPETIKLKSAPTNFTQAKTDDFNLTSLVLKDVKILFTIEIFLADEFLLNRTITISIDDVEFYIYYIIIEPDILSEPGFFRTLLIIAAVATALIGGYFILYQRILKYPVPIRKVRKYRKTLNNDYPPSKKIISQELAFNKSYNRQLNKTSNYLKLKAIGKIIEPTGKAGKVAKVPSVKPNGGAKKK